MAADDDWEESLLVMELNGIIDSDWINKFGNTWKIVGIETETPLLQMDHYVFTGKYEDTVGTNVLFQVDKYDPDQDRHMCNSMADQPQRLSYSAHTFRRLHMQRSFLTAKNNSAPQQEAAPKGTRPSVDDTLGDEDEDVVHMETDPVPSELSPADDELIPSPTPCIDDGGVTDQVGPAHAVT